MRFNVRTREENCSLSDPSHVIKCSWLFHSQHHLCILIAHHISFWHPVSCLNWFLGLYHLHYSWNALPSQPHHQKLYLVFRTQFRWQLLQHVFLSCSYNGQHPCVPLLPDWISPHGSFLCSSSRSFWWCVFLPLNYAWESRAKSQTFPASRRVLVPPEVFLWEEIMSFSKIKHKIQHKQRCPEEFYSLLLSGATASSKNSWQHMPVYAQLLQSCPTLCDPVDCSPPGSNVHGIFQARILEWVATSYSSNTSLGTW